MNTSKRVKVSVCMITYGHEAYIKEAIEGVLMQEGNLEIELIIADDCSPDETFKLVDTIKKNHPNRSWIHYTKHRENKGMMPNFIWALEQCKGNYIAFCEGDDYWTDPLKLQKQVDFLEGNEDYGICFHNVKLFNQNLNLFQKDNITKEVSETTTVLDLAKGNYIHTPSVVLRNDFFVPRWFKNVPLGDWTLYMIMIADRKIKKIKDEMGVYRLHDISLWSNKSQETRNELTKQSVFFVYSNHNFSSEVRELLRLRLGIKNKKKGFFSEILKRLKKI